MMMMAMIMKMLLLLLLMMMLTNRLPETLNVECDAMRCVCVFVFVCVAVGRENAIYDQARHGSTGHQAASAASAAGSAARLLDFV